MNDIGGSTMMNFVIKLSTGSASPANFTALGTLYGFYYYISFEINKSWSDAKTHAESIGASLLDIKGPSEYQFLSSSGITHRHHYCHCFIFIGFNSASLF